MTDKESDDKFPIYYKNKHNSKLKVMYSYPWFTHGILLDENNTVILSGVPIEDIKKSKSWIKNDIL